MTQKQRYEVLFSLLRGDIHSDNPHLLKLKEDIQKNTENILQLEEEGKDAKSEVVSLLMNFYKGYEDLFGQNGQLIENLKEETEKKRGDSLNDSESEEHSKGDKPQLSSKNVESLPEKENSEVVLEAYLPLEVLLRQIMGGDEIKKENLKLANTSLSNKVKENEAIIGHLTINAEDLKKQLEAKEEEVRSLNSQFEEKGHNLIMKVTDLQIEKSELLAECNQLKRELDTTRKDASETKQKLDEAKGEKLKNIDKLNKANSTVKELENKLKQLRDENSILNQSKIKVEKAEKIADSCKAEIRLLRDANSKLQVDLGAAIKKQETANSYLDDLKKENMELREGKNMSASELSQAETKIRNLESELEQTKKKASTLQQSGKDLYRKFSDLESRLKATKEKFDEKTMHVNKLQKELHLLSTQKSEVEEEKKLEQRCMEYKLLMENLEETLESKIVAQETRISYLKGCIGELVVNLKQQIDRLFVKIRPLKLEKDVKDLAEKLNLESVVLSLENEQLSSEKGNLNLKPATAEEEKKSLQSEITTPAIGLQEDESTTNIPAIDSEHLKEQIKAKEDEAHSSDSQEEKVRKLYELFEQIKVEWAKATVDYEIMRETLEDRVKELSQEKQTLDAIKCENSEYIEKLKTADRTVKEQEKNLKLLRDENSVLKRSKTNRKGAGKIADSVKAERLSAENESLNLKLKASEEEKRGLQSDIMISEEKLREAESTLKNLIIESEQLKEQLKAKEDMTDMLAKCEKLQHELEASDKDASEYEANLEAAKGEDSKFVAELEKENSTLIELEKKLKQLRDENSVLGQIKIKLKEVDLLSIQKSKAEEEVKKLEKSSKELAQKLELCETENAAARKEIAKLSDELRRSKSQLLGINQMLTRIEKDLQSLRQQSDQDCERLSLLDAQHNQRQGDAENEKNEQ